MESTYNTLEQKSGKNIGVHFTLSLKGSELNLSQNEVRRYYKNKLYFVQIVKDDLKIGEQRNVERIETAQTAMLNKRLSAEGWAVDQQIKEILPGNNTRLCNVDPRYLAKRLNLVTPIQGTEFNTYLEIGCSDWRNLEIKFGDEPSTFVKENEKLDGEMKFYAGLFIDLNNRLTYIGRAVSWGFKVTASDEKEDNYYKHSIEYDNPQLLIDNSNVKDLFENAGNTWLHFIQTEILSDANTPSEAKKAELYTLYFN